MWDDNLFSNEFTICDFQEGNFPLPNMFGSNCHYTMGQSRLMKSQPREVSESFIRHRREYILEVCKSSVLCDKSDSTSFFAYVFYRSGQIPTLYFTYVKKSFRNKGAMKYLLQKTFGTSSLEDFKVSYPFQMPQLVLEKMHKSQFFL